MSKICPIMMHGLMVAMEYNPITEQYLAEHTVWEDDTTVLSKVISKESGCLLSSCMWYNEGKGACTVKLMAH